METTYFQKLYDLGFSPKRKDCWAIVGTAPGTQGWKLHLSTIQIEVSELLTRVAPVLKSFDVAFKIAYDETVLTQLNEGELGYAQVGKFMTIYPATDALSVTLANTLLGITEGMNGPNIPSDEKLGDIVYSRYGSYNPIILRDSLGQIFSYIYNSKGQLILDKREVPFHCSDDISNPFSELIKNRISNENKSDNNKLFGPGYLILDLIKHNAKGSIFKALDLRSQDQVSIKVIKQGRKFCLSDRYGRDIRDRLRRQEQFHFKLADKLKIPKATNYFEVNGDGYLPIEYIEGETIETFIYAIFKNGTWSSLQESNKTKILTCLLKLIKEVKKLHSCGYIHRDIAASNVWITKTNEVYLLDLELAYHLSYSEIPFGNGTPGFMSPNQQRKLPPELEDDVFAIGCIMLLAITGLDPRRLIQLNINNLIAKLKALAIGVPQKLLEIICACVTTDPKQRPILETITLLLEETIKESNNNLSKRIKANKEHVHPNILSKAKILSILKKGVNGMIHDTPITQNFRLWLSPKINNNNNKPQQNFTELELRKGTHRGVAGVIYTLSRIQKFTKIRNNCEEINAVIKWLIEENQIIDSGMPGLYFGDSGIAVAINEAIKNNLAEPNEEISKFINNALMKKVEWYDITHGISGQGLALLHCDNYLTRVELQNRLSQKAKYLISLQEPDGSWKVPEGVEGISGEVVSGFAHGVAGIIYFLSEYAYRFSDEQAKVSCKSGIDWLINNSIESNNCIEWYYSEKNKDIWKWWCHGSPGISLTFLKLYELTSEKRYADYAVKALNIHPDHLIFPNLSQCHGLSGLGEIYLEAYRVLKDKKWFDKSRFIANTIYNLRFEISEQSFVWLVENSHVPTADLMVGMSGILHFFLRLMLKGEYIGFPMLLNPPKFIEASTTISKPCKIPHRFLPGA